MTGGPAWGTWAPWRLAAQSSDPPLSLLCLLSDSLPLSSGPWRSVCCLPQPPLLFRPLLSLCLSLQSLSASVLLSLGPSFLPSLPCYLLCTCPLSGPLQPHYQALCDVGWGLGPPKWGGKTTEPPKACTQKVEGPWEGHQPREGGRCWRWGSGPGLLGPGEGKLGRKGADPLGERCPPPPTRRAAGWGPEEAP